MKELTLENLRLSYTKQLLALINFRLRPLHLPVFLKAFLTCYGYEPHKLINVRSVSGCILVTPLASGESSDRISVLPVWREVDYFNQKERAALAIVEAITLIADGQVPNTIYDQAAASLSQDELSAIEWLAVVINTWNRIAISSRYPVKP